MSLIHINVTVTKPIYENVTSALNEILKAFEAVSPNDLSLKLISSVNHGLERTFILIVCLALH